MQMIRCIMPLSAHAYTDIPDKNTGSKSIGSKKVFSVPSVIHREAKYCSAFQFLYIPPSIMLNCSAQKSSSNGNSSKITASSAFWNTKADMIQKTAIIPFRQSNHFDCIFTVLHPYLPAGYSTSDASFRFPPPPALETLLRTTNGILPRG